MSEDHCPHCGEPLPPRAVACRECGSDFETGWSDEIEATSVELPEGPLPTARSPTVRTVALLCIVILLGGAIVLLGGELWQTLLVVAAGASLVFGVRRGDPPAR